MTSPCASVTNAGLNSLCTNFPDFYNGIFLGNTSTMLIEDVKVDITGSTEDLHLFHMTSVGGTACNAVTN